MRIDRRKHSNTYRLMYARIRRFKRRGDLLPFLVVLMATPLANLKSSYVKISETKLRVGARAERLARIKARIGELEGVGDAKGSG